MTVLLELYQNQLITEEEVSLNNVSQSITTSLRNIFIDIQNEDQKEFGMLKIILRDLLRTTESKYGSILFLPDPTPSFVKNGEFIYITLGIDEDDQNDLDLVLSPTKKMLKEFVTSFHFGEKIIISNDVRTDPRFKWESVTDGIIDTILSIPILGNPKEEEDVSAKTSGRLTIINRRGGYSKEDVEWICPILSLITDLLKNNATPASSNEINKRKNSDLAKDKFLATMSHELRTPLNGIVGMVTMLRDAGPLTNKQSEYLEILMECSHQLMNMMNNILDFSKMASNRLTLLRNPLSIKKAVQDAVMMLEGKAKAKNLSIIVKIPDDGFPTLVGDSQRLTQIVSNLLSNAVKFTQHGHIKILVRSKEITSETGYVKKWKITFKVEDTGIGIPLDEQEKIFDVFHQSPTLDTAMNKTGTGLGLSIARELVRLMDGKITVKSEPNKGSTFTFYIIADEEIEITQLQREYRDIITGAKVLVVDDRVENRVQLTDMLFKWKCIPMAVGSGEEALQYLANNICFNCIIVDICMPYMNGIELAQELRSIYKHIPLIAISSIDLNNGIELFDHYMNKPIDSNLIFPVLLDCLAKNKEYLKDKGGPCGGGERLGMSLKTSYDGKEFSRTMIPSKKRQKRPKSKLRILVVEDDTNNAYTIKEMLGYLGYNKKRIRHVDNGAKCLEILKERTYDVILMDIIMPIMDGIEATKHIRQMREHPYIIAVSAAVQNSDKQRCQQVGIDGYLAKPILKEKLEAALSPLTISE